MGPGLERLQQLPIQGCIPRPAPSLSNPQESHPPPGLELLQQPPLQCCIPRPAPSLPRRQGSHPPPGLELLQQPPLQCCIPRPAPSLSNLQESHPPLGWNCFYSCLFSAAFPGQLLLSPIFKRAILLLAGTASTAASSVLHSPASSFSLQSSV